MERKNTEDDSRILIGFIMTSRRVSELLKKLAHFDENTFRHCLNVAYITGQLCMQMELEDKKLIEEITKGALLHDIGKIKIPKEILNKKEHLDSSEYQTIKKHSVHGERILREYGFSDIVCEIALLHHEKKDGTGYPWGLSSDEIPIHAKIVGVVDAYDAMTAERCYKPAYTANFTLDALQNMNCYSDHLLRMVESVFAR